MKHVLPTGHWHLLALVAVATLCAPHAGARAQSDAAIESSAQPQPFAEAPAARAEEPVPPAGEPAPFADEPAPFADEPAPSAERPPSPDQPRPFAEQAAPSTHENGPVSDEPASPAEGPNDTDADAETTERPAGIGNDDVLAMVEAEFSDSTIISIIGANAVAFDLSPRALVALKLAGASEPVIEAMIDAEEAQSPAAEPGPTTAELAETQASLEYARLTEMIEQLAEQQEEALKARRAPEPPAPRATPAPRVWLIRQSERAEIAPTIAQVAITGAGNRRGERMKNLQGLANQALAFANPAVSGIASTLGSLFRPDEEGTAVWALAATQSSRVLDVSPVFEIDFAHIPGVDPDRYQPEIVQLVPTKDNYRLVAAAETDSASSGALPRGPIIEENVPTESTRLGRGQYRVAPRMALGPGEYALVLRPIPESRGSRRRDREASLGELLGGSTSQILYLTWEFSIAS